MRIYNFAYDWLPRVGALTKRFVSIPSVVGTPGETACALEIYAVCQELPYFAAHPEHLVLRATEHDAHVRYNLFALVRGNQAPAEGARTMLLLGHLDTVDIADYGPHRDLACDPDRLAAAVGALPGYMVGRGSLDMKSGLAANLAVLERMAAGEGLQDRCLLLVITPDEEDGSKGILSAVAALPELAAEWGLELEGAINSDYTAPRYPQDNARYIYGGTIGKLLPSLFVAGRETHVGEPFNGFDPNWLVAEVTRRVDYNPDLCDHALGEVTSPPVSLKLTDLKVSYSVQTALASWAYFNWFTFTKSADEVLTQFQGLVAAALTDLHTQFKDRAERWAALAGEPPAHVDWAPQVYTFAHLSAVVAAKLGVGYEQEVAARLQSDPSLDLRTFSCRLTEALWRVADLPAPAAVVGFSQVYSPPMRLEQGAPLMTAVRRVAAEVAAETNLAIKVRHFFPYISDMSFLGCPEGAHGLYVLRQNSPGWGRLYIVDHEAHARLNLPVINIGPWGEGAHTRHERVETAYSFAVVPELIWRTLLAL